MAPQLHPLSPRYTVTPRTPRTSLTPFTSLTPLKVLGAEIGWVRELLQYCTGRATLRAYETAVHGFEDDKDGVKVGRCTQTHKHRHAHTHTHTKT